MAYSFTEANIELKKQGKNNFIYNTPETISSKILIEILNIKAK